MPLRSVVILFAVGALALFAALNWSAFTAPTMLRFGFGAVEAPLGLIMLGITAFLIVLFLAFVVYLQTTVLLAERRHTRELQAQRGLADQSEMSRYTDLRQFVEMELEKDRQRQKRAQAEVLDKLDQLENDLRGAIEQSANALAAYSGELDDFLKRKLGEPDQIKPKP
jgi:uncharacterized integral membrane protein